MRLFALSVLLCCAAMAQAAVYVGDSHVWQQPDGTPVPVRIWGDEFSIDVETPDGWALRRDAGDWWRYGTLDANGALVASPLAVGAGDPATLGVAKHLRQSRAQRQAEAAAQRTLLQRDAKGRVDSPTVNAVRSARVRAAGPLAAPGSPTTGTRHGITLLIRFSDHLADEVHTQATVDSFCNQVGYTGFGNNGSVRDYFYDNSLGRLTYTNQVTAYITAPQPRSYYADTAAAYGTRARELVISALDAVNPSIDFAGFDGNNDGLIDAINVFYAGTCPNSWSQGIWPHQSSVTWNSGDSGKQASVYQITDMGPSLTLGTFCHENGHMICDFPDVYDYDYDSSGGAGYFCLMNSGGHGTNPARVSGYLALSAAWRDAVDLVPTIAAQTATAVAAAVPLVGAPNPPERNIYRFRKPAVPTEYFLFENRRANGRDATLPCSGLAIWHVDELGNHNDQRYTSNSAHQNYEVALIQADDRFDLEDDANDGDATDLWFAGNGASDGIFDDGLGLDPQANDARWWDGTVSNLIIDSISAPGASMTFNYRLPTPPPPASELIGFSGSQVVDYEGSAGNRFIYLTVARQAYPDDAHVDWAIVPGSASLVAPADYTAGSGTIDWAAGDTAAKTIAIQVNGDTLEETDEFFTVRLSNPTGAGTPALSASIDMLIVLRNDDGASADLAASTAASIQGNGTGDDTSCGAGAITGLLLGIGCLGLVRRRRR